MGDESAALGCEQKSGWRRIAPRGEAAFGRQTVERVVEFHRVELLDIEFEPSRGWKFFRIESAAPVLVMPT
jgi:hypothetical protein